MSVRPQRRRGRPAGASEGEAADGADQAGAWQDLLRPGLAVVFVGYNPSLVAWRTGHYYANPGNRFYHLLFASGLTPRLLSPDEDRTLLDHGIGATDLLAVPSAGIDAYPPARFRVGAAPTVARLLVNAPRAVCCNGLGVYRCLLGRDPARLGRQPGVLLGASAVFAVPSSSGRVNGRASERLAAFRELADWLASPDAARPP